MEHPPSTPSAQLINLGGDQFMVPASPMMPAPSPLIEGIFPTSNGGALTGIARARSGNGAEVRLPITFSVSVAPSCFSSASAFCAAWSRTWNALSAGDLRRWERSVYVRIFW